MSAKRGSGLQITPVYRDIKLSYSEADKNRLLQKAFLEVPLFRKVCERFNNQKLPIEIFDKLLMREFNVNENHVGKVKWLFIKGAREVDLMAEDDTISCQAVHGSIATDNETDSGRCDENDSGQTPPKKESKKTPPGPTAKDAKRATLPLDESDDLVILEWPKEISEGDYTDISDWLDFMKRKIKKSIVT